MAASLGFLPKKSFSAGLLPWALATLVFMAALTTFGGLGLHQSIERWRSDVERTLTIQIAGGGAQDMVMETEAALAVLRNFPGIEAATPLTAAEIASLLEPWLGAASLTDDLPIPRLIDVRLEENVDLNIAALQAALAENAPHAIIDDPRDWLSQIHAVVGAAQWLASIVVLLIGMVAVSIIVYAAHARMAIHRGIVEVVHLMGARDGTIAREFQWRFLLLGAKAGLIGMALATVAVFGIGLVLDIMLPDSATPLLPSLRFTPEVIAIAAAFPLFTGLLTMMTSYVTVRRALRQIR